MSWFGQRPETPQSGVLLQHEYSIQHRSDLLMLEHMMNVSKAQEAMREAILDLEQAKTGEDFEIKKKEMEEIKEKCDHLIIVLKMMHKLNREVAYARADLDDALYNGHGNINAARKRVIWLEDKMGSLCGKRRLKNSSDFDFDLDQHDQVDFMGSDTDQEFSERAQLSESEFSNQNVPSLGIVGSGGMDRNILPPRIRYSQNTSREAVSLGAAIKRAKVLREIERQSQASMEKEPTPEPLYKHKPIIFAESEEESVEEEEEESDEEELRQDEEDKKESEEEAEQMSVSVASSAGQDMERLTTANSEVKPTTDQLDAGTLEQAPTFLTEVSTPKSRVTINEYKKSYADPMPSAPSPDLAEQYWNSEHHRFELSEFAEVMRDLDPLSYHNVGLAVPGSFIDREDTRFEELPWRPHRKGSDIKDIHRIALDKLATRIYGMHDKLYSAAMLSVKKTRKEEDVPREASFLQTLDNRLSSKGSERVLIERPMTKGSRPITVETVELPKLEERRLGTSASGRLVYYPKPIPPPDVLPITRTNQSKVYPRLTSSYADVTSCQLEPAQRIVDQRNLLEETRLVLYRERPKGRPRGPSVHERRFRRMLERDKANSSKASA